MMKFKEIVKTYGDVIHDGKSIVENDRQIIPLSPALDSILGGGILEGSFFILTGQPKVGKALWLSSVVYTPDGPKFMAHMKVGDKVCTPDGNISTVKGVYYQGMLDAYEVKFSNGDTVICCKEHLWEIKARQKRVKQISPLKDFKDDLYYADGKNKDRPKWSIAIPKYISFKKQNLSIHPYVLGALIGDGGISQRDIRFTTIDEEVITQLNSLLLPGFEFKKLGNTISYRLCSNRQSNIYLKYLKERCGLLGRKSTQKFIPDIYRYSSREQRIELLQGLMDTDGYVDKRGNVAFSSSSKLLAKDTKEVAQSLGYHCLLTKRTTHCDGKPFISYRVRIKGDNLHEIFSLQRKIQRCKQRKKPPITRKIISVTHIGKRPMQCIEIDDPMGLYLTNNFIVTHNTVSALSFAATCQKPEYGGREIFYGNIEGRLKKRDIEGIEGLDLQKFHIFGSTQGNILTADKYLSIGERLIHEHPGAIIIFDSFSALVTGTELTSGMEEFQRADGPKVIAKFCRKVGNIVPVNRNIVIGITHLMGNPSGYGKAYKEKSGQSLSYQTDTKIWANKSTKLMVGEQSVGLEVEWEVVTSSIGPPGVKTNSVIRFGVGIDHYLELVRIGVDLGFIKKAGSWYTFEGLEQETKVQGEENARQILIDNPDLYNSIYKRFREFFE